MVTALVVFVALQHVMFMVLEMFLWDRPPGRKLFRLDEDFANRSAVLAANQGLYNGFLAAGLVYGLLLGAAGQNMVIFMLVCVATAGIFGGMTVSRTIFLVQSLPAMLTLGVMWFTV